jgi:uncharacterized protein
MKDAVYRTSEKQRPRSMPLMHQNWGKLLFMHWPVSISELRPLIPNSLSIDLFDDIAWIGVVPFTMWGIRATGLPPIPGLSAFHELNVRTYVHYRGVPGVWFFSLDANSRLAVWGARQFYHLPYRFAEMRLRQERNVIDYSSKRLETKFGDAEFDAVWEFGDSLPPSEPGSLTYFLTERYCLYATHQGKLYRSDISHQRWPLREASLINCSSSMVDSFGINVTDTTPLLHYAEEVNVDVWPLKRV